MLHSIYILIPQLRERWTEVILIVAKDPLKVVNLTCVQKTSYKLAEQNRTFPGPFTKFHCKRGITVFNASPQALLWSGIRLIDPYYFF